MNLATTEHVDEAAVLVKAFTNAGKTLGLNKTVLGEVVGRDRTAFVRGRLAPDSKAGELALLLIRCYRSLYALMGGNEQQMRHWMRTENVHTGGVPAEQVRTVTGLTEVVAYLDAIRGKN